jgi:hypothetical protein
LHPTLRRAESKQEGFSALPKTSAAFLERRASGRKMHQYRQKESRLNVILSAGSLIRSRRALAESRTVLKQTKGRRKGG